MEAGDAPDGAEGGFELLGVLLMAHVLRSADLAMDEVGRFHRSPRVTQSNSMTLTTADGVLEVRADVRAGCETFTPSIALPGGTIPDTVLATAEGAPLGRLVGGWLSHPDLIVEGLREGPGGSHRLDVRPTRLTPDEAVAAISAMRAQLDTAARKAGMEEDDATG